MVPEAWFSKVAENCVGVNVFSACGVVCISEEQLDHYFVGILNKLLFSTLCFIDTV